MERAGHGERRLSCWKRERMKCGSVGENMEKKENRERTAGREVKRSV